MNNTDNTRNPAQQRPTQNTSAPRTVQPQRQGTPTARPVSSQNPNAQRRPASAASQRPATPGMQPRPAQRPAQTTSAQQRPSGTQPRPSAARPASSQTRVGTEGRLTAEERRRMEAARLAAMNSVKRISDEEQDNLRKLDLQFLEDEQPSTGRASQKPVEPQNREDTRGGAVAYRRKKGVKINWGAILFVLIIAAVIGVSAWQISNNPALPPSSEGESTDIGETLETTDPTLGGSEDGETEPPEEDIPLVLYDTKLVLNKYVDVGYQILVNNDHRYARVDEVETLNAYSSRNYFTNEYIGQSVRLKVSGTNLGMEETAFRALEAMFAGLVADTGCDDLLITSGYRTIADQQSIWDRNLAQSGKEYTERYVAIPGHSEHHTGLACDLSFYTDDGATIPVLDHEYGSWLWDNCSDYGFILRYLKDKEEITHIAYEPWHFRYVGIPHAKAVEHFEICYEEYIDVLKGFTFDTKMLYVKADGKVTAVQSEEMPGTDGYLIYYVPMAEGESTEIKIPAAFEYEDLSISGNNVDGFIVTVTLYSSEN